MGLLSYNKGSFYWVTLNGRWGVIRFSMNFPHHNNHFPWLQKLNYIKIAFISLAFGAANEDTSNCMKSDLTCSLTQGSVLRGGWLIFNTAPVFAVLLSLASILARLSWKLTILINRTPCMVIHFILDENAFFNHTAFKRSPLSVKWDANQHVALHATFSLVTL